MIVDGDGNEVLLFSSTASAVNELTVRNNTSGSAPQIQATGSDTNVSINLVPKGTGRLYVNGILVPTTTSSDTLTNKIIPAVSGIGRMDLYHSFLDDADGSPVNADSGGAWTLTHSRAGAEPVVSSGRFVINDSASGAAAGYLTKQLAGTVVYMEAEFDMTTVSTTGQRAALVAWENAMPSGLLSGGTQRSPAHVIFGPAGYSYQTYDTGAGGAATVGYVAYETAAYPGAGLQKVAIALVPSENLAVVRGPDGKITTFTDAMIGTVTAPYACCEVYYTAANTDGRVRFRKFRAASSASADNIVLQAKADALVAAGRASVQPSMYYSIASLTAAANTGLQTVTGPEVYATAPPSGVIFVEVSARVQQTSAGQYGWSLRDLTASTDFPDLAEVVRTVSDMTQRKILRANGCTPGKGYRLGLRHIATAGTTSLLGGTNDPVVMRVVPGP